MIIGPKQQLDGKAVRQSEGELKYREKQRRGSGRSVRLGLSISYKGHFVFVLFLCF